MNVSRTALETVSPEQDQIPREYARLFVHVERTLYADVQKGKRWLIKAASLDSDGNALIEQFST